jgi:hypothetical protein
MKTIDVEITGITPLMMNSPKYMIKKLMDGENTTKKVVRDVEKTRDLKEEAERVAYRSKNGYLYLPSEAIKGCLLNAAVRKKTEKGFPLKSIINANVYIEPNEISLGTKNYKVDIRTCVLQGRNRIVVARPVIETWKAHFTILVDYELSNTLVKNLLEEAGLRYGILAFRPAKGGTFGKFKINHWKEK